MMFCIILIILDFSVLSRQNMKIKNAENKQTIKQYSAYAKNRPKCRKGCCYST